MPVEISPLDFLISSPRNEMERIQQYWEYIQCTTPNCPAWLRRRNVGVEDWGRKRWLCHRNWRTSFEEMNGFYYWDPINKRQWTGCRRIGALQKGGRHMCSNGVPCKRVQISNECAGAGPCKRAQDFFGCGRCEKTFACQWHSLGSSMFGQTLQKQMHQKWHCSCMAQVEFTCLIFARPCKRGKSIPAKGLGP